MRAGDNIALLSEQYIAGIVAIEGIEGIETIKAIEAIEAIDTIDGKIFDISDEVEDLQF